MKKLFQILEKIDNYYKLPNIFEILGKADDEHIHSMFISYLLNPSENHGINCMFLEAFIAEIAACIDCSKSIFNASSLKTAKVAKEKEYNIDIRVDLPDCKTVIIIENKWNADERTEGADNGQLCKYRKAIESDFKYAGWKKFYVFLTVDGHKTKVKSEEKHWISMSYRCISNALGKILHNNLQNSTRVYVEAYKKIVDMKIDNDKFINMNKAEVLRILKSYDKRTQKVFIDACAQLECNDVIELFRKDGIELDGKHIDVEKLPKNRKDLVQFMHMMPDNVADSIHFEVIQRGDCISPEFHVECKTKPEAKKNLKELYHDRLSITSAGSMKLCGKKFEYKGKDTYEVKKDVEAELCKLMNEVMPMLRNVANRIDESISWLELNDEAD